MILQWLASPEWANVVKALLHTLWQGAVAVVILGLALRHLRHPVARYRCSLAALAGIMFAGLITWAILNRPVAAPPGAAAPVSAASLPVRPMLKSDAPVVVVNSPPPTPAAPQFDWTAWLALIWLTGAGAMLVRAGCQVAGAEHLRRSARPLEDARLAGLLAETRRAVRLARRVRMAVTDQLTSPAVVGVLVPTLILPLSLLTSLSPEQLRFVLLHELAHIRRGDYFANLFQLFAEALLFFNPAVWWISRQIRIEREACCDALAIELSGAPADYAQTLVHVAERVLQPAPAAAPALGNRREPSSLADRIQRLLVPGYRPRLRLTWRAMITALLVGGALLFVSALGTRVTIAAILPPQERIERIEKKMAEYGVNPAAANFNIYDQHAPQVKIAGHIRMADGSRVPQWLWLNVNSSVGGNSTGTSFIARYGAFSNSIRAGTIYLGAQTENSAPTVLGPLDGTVTNAFENLDIVLGPGFDVPLQLVDADSGKALPAGELATMFWMNNNGLPARSWKSGPDGSVLLTRCADLPLDVTVNVPGYEIIKQRFDHLHAGETLRLPLRHGEILSGRVLDQTTGRPVAGAEIHLLYQSDGINPGNFQWDDALHRLGQSDADGDFTLNQLRRGWSYYLGVSAPGHESLILQNVSAGASNLVMHLGSELIVRGRVIGDLGRLQRFNGEPAFSLGTTEVFGQTSDGYSQWVPLHLADGVATFQFTNRTPGSVTLSGGNYSEDRDVTAPIADWVVNLNAAAKTAAKNPPKRDVIFRFKYPAGAPPVGTVEATVPDSLETNHLTAHLQEMEITNGEVETQIAIGGRTQIQPKHMVGYWFDQWAVGGNGFITVTNGPGPLVLDIPLIPAGAIYAHARNADGTPAGGLLFGVSELKRAPDLGASSTVDSGSDSFSDNAPRKWVSGPLPLGGTYQIYASRGNSFCVSQPVKLTGESPDAEVELQFPPGQSFHGVLLGPDGKPLADTQLTGTFLLSENHSFGLQPIFTDDQGRFELDDATPTTGRYQVEADVPGLMAENTKLDFHSQPQTIRLQRGHVLGGRLVEAGTGYAITNAEVRAWVMNDSLPGQTAYTDADGRFEFTTLSDADYTLYANGGQMTSNREYPADGNTNLTVAIKLYAWSTAKPMAPGVAASTTAASDPPDSPIAANDPPPDSPDRIASFTLFHPIPEAELKKRLTDAGVNIPPTTFIYNPIGLFLMRGTPDQLALAQREEYRLNSSPPPHGPLFTVPVTPPGTNLYQRTFRINPVFLAHLREQPGFETNTVSQTLRALGSQLGVDWTSPRGKSVFYNDQRGIIFVKASESDLDAVERLINVLNQESLPSHRSNRASPAAGVAGAFSTNQMIFTGPGRQAILSKLQQIRLDNVSFDAAPLAEVLRQFSAEARKLDPDDRGINFLINDNRPARAGLPTIGLATIDPMTGLPLPGVDTSDTNDAGNFLVTIRPALHNVSFEDALEAVVKGASPQLHFSVEDFAVVFSAGELPPPLVSRTFRINTNAFPANLQGPADGISDSPVPTNSFPAWLRKVSADRGVDWGSPTGKTVFYSFGKELLFVKATAADLDVIEKILVGLTNTNLPPQAMPQAAPQTNSILNWAGPDHANIMTKLDRIRIPQVSFESLRLDEAVRRLNQMAVEFDPDKTGVPISLAPNSATNSDDVINSAVIQIPSLTDVRLEDVLDAVVLVADKPLKYSITDHGVVFSAKGPERPQLFMRTFRVYPSTFSSGMKDALAGGGLPYTALPNSNSTPSQVARAFFTILGVNLNEPPGKSVFYNGRQGFLFVKATATDLDTIERALDVLIQVAPQIHLKARFIAVPEDSFDFGRFKISTNVADGQIAGILTESEMKTVVKTLASTDKVINLSDPEITVISGRQTQMNAFAVITTTATNLEIGPTLDVVPYVLADNYTINLALIPSFRDIERYDRITNNLGQVVNLSDVSPRFQIQPRVAAVNIWDGQTVVLGGFEERDLKGNILTAPARKLLVFVTASLVDPAGNRIHSEDQLPFAQEAVPPQPTTLQAQPRGVPGWDFPDPPRKPAWPDPQLLPAQEFKVPALRNLF